MRLEQIIKFKNWTKYQNDVGTPVSIQKAGVTENAENLMTITSAI